MSYIGRNYLKIPTLDSYRAVADHFKNVEPIKGRKEEVRPIGKRRYDHATIVEQTIAVGLSPENPLGTFAKAYTCQLYETDIVKFYPNGCIELYTRNFACPSTRDFINNCIKSFGYIETLSGKWYFINKKEVNPSNPARHYLLNRFYRNGTKNPTLLIPNPEDGLYYVADPIKEKRHNINRKALKDVKDKYKFFTEYGFVALSINTEIEIMHPKLPSDRTYPNFGDVHPNEHLREHGIPEFRYLSWSCGGSCSYYANSWASGEVIHLAYHNQESLFKTLDTYLATGDINLLYSAYQYVANENGRASYRSEKKICNPSYFVKKFEELLKEYFREIVFEEVEVPLGRGFVCRNKKYFSFEKPRTNPCLQGNVQTAVTI